MRKGVVPTLTRCVARQDGGYLLILSNGQSGYSPTPLTVGCRVKLDAAGKVAEPA